MRPGERGAHAQIRRGVVENPVSAMMDAGHGARSVVAFDASASRILALTATQLTGRRSLDPSSAVDADGTLRSVVRRLRMQVRERAVVARVGGHELADRTMPGSSETSPSRMPTPRERVAEAPGCSCTRPLTRRAEVVGWQVGNSDPGHARLSD